MIYKASASALSLIISCFGLTFFLMGCGEGSKKKDPEVGERADENDKQEQVEEFDLESELATDYSVADLHASEQKALSRIERLGFSESQIVSLKTWKTPNYIWTTLTYKPEPNLQAKAIYLACHFHGQELGCHSKDASGPEEP